MSDAVRQRPLLYGRRKGPKLSAHQQKLRATLLPCLSLALETGRDPVAYFSVSVGDVWLEIGFGGGEHLLWQAQRFTGVGMIGAEPYESGVAKLLSKLDAHRSPRAQAVGESTNIFDRIRIHEGDARDIIAKLPDASVGRVFILFPDPWPKTRHHKRRFIQTAMLDALARVLKSGGELRFASDDAGYLAWALERLSSHPAFSWEAQSALDWTRRPNDWPQTRYEAKALHGAPHYLRFRKK